MKTKNRMNMQFVGVDYGSKLAGTTVLSFLGEGGKVRFMTSEKKKDADQFLLDAVTDLKPLYIFFDAPLSLPGVYTKPEAFEDYFYRKGDKLLRAMSPMFLGGLTARAMRLKKSFEGQGIKVVETYPAVHAQRMELKSYHYKKQLRYIPDVLAVLQHNLPFGVDWESINTWHQVDALLAYYAGFRYMNDEAESFGDAAEGLIWV